MLIDLSYHPITLTASVSHAISFAKWDWVVLGGYAALLVVTGWWTAKRNKSADTADYFLGGRRMPAWAVTISFVATTLSAATFIGGPEQAFRGNLAYLSSNIGNVIAAFVVAFLFIPAFYRRRVSTVYELLENRAGAEGRIAASAMFMVGRVFASGARLYMGALAASLVVFGDIDAMHVMWGVVAFTVVGIVYTLIGGVASVIWTDVIQFFIFVSAAAIAGAILFHRIPVPLEQIIDALRHPDLLHPDVPSKLTWLESGLRKETINHSYTLISAIFGFSLFGIAAYGTDQDMTQRMLTCKTADRGSKSIIAAIFLGIPVTILFMLIGLLLFVFYRRPDLMGINAPSYGVDDSRKIFLTFILREMPTGVSGLMMAGLFAAGLSSLNSALNAMASAFTNDVYKKIAPDRDEGHYLRVGQGALIGWGILVGAFAVVCIAWQSGSEASLIDFALGVMTFAYSGLLGVFLTVLLTKRRGNAPSVIAALVIGFVIVLAFQPFVWDRIWPGGWGVVRLAFPWQMLIASGISFAVCLTGRSNGSAVPDDGRS